MTKELENAMKTLSDLADEMPSMECKDWKMAINTVLEALKQQPCEDAVSRQAVKDRMIKYGFCAPDMTVTEFIEDELQPVTTTRKVGHWIRIAETDEIVCESCNRSAVFKSSFCPSCGADMRGKQE